MALFPPEESSAREAQQPVASVAEDGDRQERYVHQVEAHGIFRFADQVADQEAVCIRSAADIQQRMNEHCAKVARLKSLRDEAKLPPVSPFYAVLLMDGDELGIHMSDTNKQAAITAGLAKFTSRSASRPLLSEYDAV